jgi:hypothetical protein
VRLVAMNHYSWTRYRQLRDHVTHLAAATSEEVVVTFPGSPPASVLRALFFPHVASSWDPTTANPPPPGWWESAQVTLSFTLDPDGSGLFSRNEMGEADPPAVDLGFVKLTPHLYVRGTAAAQYTVVWTADAREIEFEGGRRIDDVTATPNVHASIWTLDSHNVFLNPGGSINVTHSLVNYGSILFNTIY